MDREQIIVIVKKIKSRFRLTFFLFSWSIRMYRIFLGSELLVILKRNPPCQNPRLKQSYTFKLDYSIYQSLHVNTNSMLQENGDLTLLGQREKLLSKFKAVAEKPMTENSSNTKEKSSLSEPEAEDTTEMMAIEKIVKNTTPLYWMGGESWQSFLSRSIPVKQSDG